MGIYPGPLNHRRHLIDVLGIDDHEGEMRVCIDWRQGQEEAWTTTSDIGDRASNFRVDGLVLQPVTQLERNCSSLVAAAAGRKVEINQILIAIACRKEFFDDKLRCINRGCERGNCAS